MTSSLPLAPPTTPTPRPNIYLYVLHGRLAATAALACAAGERARVAGDSDAEDAALLIEAHCVALADAVASTYFRVSND